mmetsp:Transcript_12132/g.26488  ORF Transcript_12132/g.26488 Transcript_12132/m.26488 type:complete len:262 (-) Transcript_12132:47-832(-)
MQPKLRHHLTGIRNNNRQRHPLIIPNLTKIQINPIQTNHGQRIILIRIQHLHNLLIHTIPLGQNDILHRNQKRRHDRLMIGNVQFAPYVIQLCHMSRILRQPQYTIAPRRSTQFLIRTFLVQIRPRLILVRGLEIKESLLKVPKDTTRRPLDIKLIVLNQFLQHVRLAQLQHAFGGYTLIHAIIQIAKPKHQIVIGSSHRIGTVGPLAHAPQANHLLHRILSDLERCLVEHVGKVGIASDDILTMRSEMRAYKTQCRIVEL